MNQGALSSPRLSTSTARTVQRLVELKVLEKDPILVDMARMSVPT